MRLWHKDLISVLPNQQLLGQWRECCCIARNIAVNGTPNHILVNKIMNYPLGHFCAYASMVQIELIKRGYKCDGKRFSKWIKDDDHWPLHWNMFIGWHNDRYLKQCLYNLQEKHDCGGITEDEWQLICERMNHNALDPYN